VYYTYIPRGSFSTILFDDSVPRWESLRRSLSHPISQEREREWKGEEMRRNFALLAINKDWGIDATSKTPKRTANIIERTVSYQNKHAHYFRSGWFPYVLCPFLTCMFPQHMLQWRHYVCILSVPASAPWQVCLSLCKHTVRISMNFAESNHTITNRINDYILGEIGTGTREQDTRENTTRRQSVWLRCQSGADP